ncbi:MAG: c-type cytochrome [Planctomycetaceae bacterium]
MIRDLCWLLLACSAAMAAESRSEQAAALVRDVRVPEGFTATIFATPAQANYPVFVAATPDGTLFVSSDGNGSLGRDPDRGRILRLRDTDGDGAADEVKTFVTSLDSPRGIVWVDGRLVVLHPPHVTAFADADRDGVADDQAGHRLVSGIAFDYSQRPADHTSNGLTLAIDGWIYAAIGDFGFMAAEGNDGRTVQLRGGGVVRFRPDGSGLDLFARGTRNTLEVAVGPLLDMITRDNTNDGGGWNVRLHAFTGLEDHGYPRRYMHFADEIVAPLADYGGGSGTGGCWIDEPWMPTAFNDAPFTCDWGRGEIYRHPLAARGAGFEAQQEPFIGITRPTDLDVDAIGNCYVASWRGGNFTWQGPDVGFIARVRPTAAAAISCPDCMTASTGELLEVLAGPSHRLRLEAQRALLARGLVPEASAALEGLAADAQARQATRVAAVFTLALGKQSAAVPVLAQLTADPTIAAWAVRALGDLAAGGGDVPLAVLGPPLASTDPRTRKEAVVALVRTGRAEAAARILPVAADADPIVAHTAVEGAVRLATLDPQAVITACGSILDARGTSPAVHRAAARVLGEVHAEAAADAVIARLATATDAAKRGDLAWAAARLWRRESAWKGDSWGTRPDTRGPYYAMEVWNASPRLRDALVAAVATTPVAELPGLARTLGLHRFDAEATLAALRDREGSMPAVVTFLELSDATPPDDLVAGIGAAAAAADAPPNGRLGAIRLLARSASPRAIRPLFDAVLAVEAASLPANLVAEARTAARGSRAAALDPAAVEDAADAGPGQRGLADDVLLAVAGASAAKSSVRGDAAARLAAAWDRDPGRRLALVAASVRTGSRVLALNLVAAAEQQADATLAKAAAEALAKLGIDPVKMREIAADMGPKIAARKIDEVLKLIDERRGDRAVGAELFVSLKCVSCHAAGVDSAGLGPSLANAAGIYNRRQLAESVLLPNKSIAQGFATTVLALDDGRSLIGFVTSEAADALSLRDGQGVEHRIPKESIEERKKLPSSVMPEGLAADLTLGQFASLIDYVESLAVAPGTAAP